MAVTALIVAAVSAFFLEDAGKSVAADAEARANATIDRTVSKVVTLIGKVCFIYLTLLVAGYIEMKFYQIEILQLLLSYPSLLTGAVLYIQHRQWDLFCVLTFITGIYFFIPVFVSVFTFLINNVMLSAFAFTVVSCLVWLSLASNLKKQ